MIPAAPVTATADASREIPADAAARLDRVEAALASLREEQRRCAVLGLEIPLARCAAQQRYWRFVGALFALEPVRASR